MNNTLFWDIFFLAICITFAVVGTIIYDTHFLSGVSLGIMTAVAVESIIKDVGVGDK